MTNARWLQVPASLKGQVSNERALRNEITATLICDLPAVTNAFTKVVILDSRGGGEARALARSVTARGFRGYEAAGGFAAWRREDMGVASRDTYDVSPGAPTTVAACHDLCLSCSCACRCFARTPHIAFCVVHAVAE